VSGRISRRRFLASAAATGVGAAGVALRPWRAVVRFVDPTTAGRLAGVFADRASAAALGRRYLRAHPAAASVDRLCDGVVARLADGRRAIAEADEDGLRRLLAGAVREDFASDRVIDVDGWVLSATEARLYALAALA
jgi:hypothetical protein